jgi:Holliday junction DNA helicase RuvA
MGGRPSRQEGDVIASLQGRILAKVENFIVLDVAGVGFKVFVPTSLWAHLGGIGQQATLFTHMRVREDEISLYGFGTADELALFELLLGVSGIGPKVGLSIVSNMGADYLREAIARGDAMLLTHVPGVGRKTAERLMLGLKDKLGVDLEFASYPALTHSDAELIAALTSLGYSVAEAQAALRSLPPTPQRDGAPGEMLPLEERIRLALQYFASD